MAKAALEGQVFLGKSLKISYARTPSDAALRKNGIEPPPRDPNSDREKSSAFFARLRLKTGDYSPNGPTEPNHDEATPKLYL
jgi:hypothetical protein